MAKPTMPQQTQSSVCLDQRFHDEEHLYDADGFSFRREIENSEVEHLREF